MKFRLPKIDMLPRFYIGIQLFAGIFSVLLGILVLFGWHTHLTILIVGASATLLLVWLTTVMRNLSNSRSALLESLDELKRSEEARRKAEDYHSLFQHANDSIVIFEPETEIILDVNDKACEVYGFSRDEFIGKSLKDMSQAVEKGERQLEDLLAEGTYNLFESVQFRSDGTPVNFLINSSVIEYQGQQAVLSINRDVTDLKRTEDALRRSLSALNATREAVFMFSPDSLQFFYVNNGAVEQTGYGHTELLRMTPLDIKPGFDEKSFRQMIAPLINGELDSHCFTTIHRRKDGTDVPVEIILQYVASENDESLFIAMVRDITSGRETQEALQKNLSLLTSTFEATADGILAVDLNNNIVTSNKKFIEMWDIPADIQDLTTQAVTNRQLSLLKNPRDLLTRMKRSLERPDEITCSILELKDGRIYERYTQPHILDGQTVGRVMSFRDITERKRTTEILQDSEARYRLLFDRNPYPIWVYDIETLQFLAVNEAAINHYGYSREEFLQLTIKDIRPPEDVPALIKFMAEAKSENEVSHTGRHRKKDGTVIEVEVAAQSIIFAGQRSRIGLVTDITERKRADIALRESEYKLRNLLESMSEGLLQVDTEDRVTFINNCFCDMVGYLPDELIGTDWTLLLLDEGRDFIKQVNERRRKGISDRYEVRLRKKSGEILWAIVGGVPVVDTDGVVTGSMGVFTDITERKRAEEQLLHDAFHDGLTGLANRTLFMDHLRMAIERGKSRHSNLYAVLYLDFDRFKVINDSLGHSEGDKLLQFIARRLEACTRTGDLVARLGGDEFVILLSELVDTSEALLVAERIQSDLKASFDLVGREIFITTSIGITLSTSGHTRAEDMLRDADIAMYRAKEQGKAQYQIFDQKMHKEAIKQLQIETEMRQALERGEFCLHYQPIFSIEEKTLVGFEALIRWKHPERGMIPPQEFIPIAEETGLILQLGQWTIHESCRQLFEWQKNSSLASNLTVSVNLSCKEFLQHDLADKIAATLKATKLDPRYLKLEITESHVMENSERAVTLIERLRALGIEMSLDDFGTGYSSLSYLHRLPVSYLKIDRSFVSRMMESDENGEIVHTIIKLAQNLKMKVIAEGIETADQLEHLKYLNCEYGQGYFLSKPLESKAAKNFISSHIANPRAIVEYPTLSSELNM